MQQLAPNAAENANKTQRAEGREKPGYKGFLEAQSLHGD